MVPFCLGDIETITRFEPLPVDVDKTNGGKP